MIVEASEPMSQSHEYLKEGESVIYHIANKYTECAVEFFLVSFCPLSWMLIMYARPIYQSFTSQLIMYACPIYQYFTINMCMLFDSKIFLSLFVWLLLIFLGCRISASELNTIFWTFKYYN